MRSPFRFTLAAVTLLGLSTFVLGSTWSVRFDNSTAYGTSITRAPSGGIVVTAQQYVSGGTLIVGLEDAGNVIWHNVLLAPAGSGGGNLSIDPTADGGYCAVKSVDLAGGQTGSSNAWLAKLDAVGNIVWQRAWNGGAGFARPVDVVAMADGGCLLVGQTQVGDVAAAWVLRADASGATLWSETIDTPAFDSGMKAKLLPSGDVVIDVSSSRLSSPNGAGLIIRLRPNGSIVWQRSLEGPNTVLPYPLTTTASGDILIGAALVNPGKGSGQEGGALVRLSAQGELLGSRFYPGLPQINGIAVAADGRIALAGGLYVFDGRFYQPDDGYIVITDANGDPIAASAHGGPGQDQLMAIADGGDGEFLVTGFSSSSTDRHPLLVEKTDSSGLAGPGCSRIIPRSVDTRPITARPSSAVLAPLTLPASPLVLANSLENAPSTELVCSAP